VLVLPLTLSVSLIAPSVIRTSATAPRRSWVASTLSCMSMASTSASSSYSSARHVRVPDDIVHDWSGMSGEGTPPPPKSTMWGGRIHGGHARRTQQQGHPTHTVSCRCHTQRTWRSHPSRPTPWLSPLKPVAMGVSASGKKRFDGRREKDLNSFFHKQCQLRLNNSELHVYI
jgi:hypothetical protein